MRHTKCLLACVAIIVSLFGCGGGATTAPATGRLTLSVIWPKPTRLIPYGAQSVRAVLTSGQLTLGSQLIVGGDGPPPSPSTVTFDNVPAGPVTLTASAYPKADGSGVAMATGAQPVTIVSGQTATVSVTMASTIDHVTLTPVNPTIFLGAFSSVTLNAFDAAGNMVLIPRPLNIVSSNPAIVSIVTGGNPTTVKGIALGASILTVTDGDTGKTANTTVTVVGD